MANPTLCRVKAPQRLTRSITRPGTPLVLVAVVYAVAQLVAVTTRMRLGWDETVYVSQVSPRVPAAFFSAPRARGVTLLAAPLVVLTPSLTALRVYMTVLSSAGLFVAYRPWTRLLRPVTVAVAALLLASLWMVQFYGNEVMPNLYVAYGAVAATGWFVHTVRGQGRLSPLWFGVSLAFVALMRPGDAAWLVLPLLVGIAFAKGRRLVLSGAVVAGLGAGALQWIVEAYSRFGGVPQRLAASSKTEGGLGWNPAGIQMNLHALNDYVLCRPCTGATSWHVPAISAWWPLIPVLAAGGLALAVRERHVRILAVPAACGVTLGAQYLLGVGYAAPRFLIPAYALLALPVALFLTGVASVGRLHWRVPASALVAAAVALLAVGQQHVLRHMVAHENTGRREFAAIAADLRGMGVRPPCTISGEQAQPIAFYAGCGSTETSGPNTSTTLAGLLTQARETNFAIVEHIAPRPVFTQSWYRYPVTTPSGKHWRVFIPGPLQTRSPTQAEKKAG